MNLLIVGFFRSGTTFLSNILNSHPNAHCIVDPFINFVKLYRNLIKKKKKNKNQIKKSRFRKFFNRVKRKFQNFRIYKKFKKYSKRKNNKKRN